MPWECKHCRTEVAHDHVQACPAWEAPKTAWTVHGEQTRTLVFGARKLAVERGARHRPGAGEAPETVPAERAWVLEKERVRALARDGTPPRAHVLTVRLFPKAGQDADVTLGVCYEHDEVGERRLTPPPPGPAGSTELRLLLAWGEGDLEEVRLERRELDPLLAELLERDPPGLGRVLRRLVSGHGPLPSEASRVPAPGQAEAVRA